jgi:2-succinyl-6-hydroxy-2,4-cyclohexadiene-1-carboxylate synthase
MGWHKQLMNDVLTLAVNGLRYRVQRWRKEATDISPRGGICLLHGFSGTGVNWRPLVGLLHSPLMIAPDLIGHGGTDVPGDSVRYQIEAAAADLYTLWGQLELPPLHVVGYSMGGRLALYTALMYPAMVTRLTLESASPGLATETERADRRAADEALADQIETNGMVWFATMWEQLPLFQHQSEKVREVLRAVRLAQSPVGLANSLRGMGTGAQPSLWERLPELSMPVDLIVGALDAKFVAINQQMAARIPTCRLQIVNATGHSVHQEQPHAAAALISPV